MKSDFMVKTAKIIAELRNRTCIDDDAEVIKEILQEELKEYYDALHECYDDGYSLGHSEGSGVHVHSQGEIYPVIQMYIGQEKVFTCANKVVPYSMKQQVLDAVADGTPAIRELFSTSTRELCTF